MKKLILLAALLLCAVGARAGSPTFIETDQYAAYPVQYVGVTASSTTAGVIPAAGNERWREVSCQAVTDTSTIYSRVSETAVSTTTLATAGSRFTFQANLGRRWETSKGIYLSVAAGGSSVAMDCEIWTSR